jgi:magnesium transporter
MLLGYPAGSVGRLMPPDFAKIRPEQTISEALDAIPSQASESETLNKIYVVDDRGRLIDEIRLRRLLVGEPSRRVADLIGGGGSRNL